MISQVHFDKYLRYIVYGFIYFYIIVVIIMKGIARVIDKSPLQSTYIVETLTRS